MADVLPTIGQDPWGVDLNTLLSNLSLGDGFRPADQGLISWTIDPSQAANNSPLVSGTVFMSKLNVRQNSTITNVVAHVSVAGTTLTAGQNFAGVYNSAGTRVGVTADQSGVWNTTGTKTMPVTVPFSAPAGDYYVALLFNGGAVIPEFAREASVGPLNVGLTAATARATTGPAGQTSLPASITMAGRTLSTISWWTAVS